MIHQIRKNRGGQAAGEERMNPKLLSMIQEEMGEASVIRPVRSRSASPVADQELDQFHSDDEAPAPAPAPALKAPLAAEEEQKGNAKPADKDKDEKKEKEKEKKEEVKEQKELPSKRDVRMQEHMRRHGTHIAAESHGEAMSVPYSVAMGSYGMMHEQEIDTNVLSLKLTVLKDKAQIATGDPIICAQCKAMFNIHSRLVKEAGAAAQRWECEFCGKANMVTVEEDEMPKADELTYVLESAQQSMVKKGDVEETSVIFCLDVSGSMCVSQRVEGRVALKYDKVPKLQELMKFSDGSYQLLQGESRNQTYISRMQCLQAAIDKQFHDLSNGAPKKKVGLVLFSNEVTLIGDATVPAKVITGDKLQDYEGLLEAALKDADAYMSKPIAQTKANLQKSLGEIEEAGQTALGPALLVAVGVASRGNPGSKVIICTDGCANVGLGSVENLATEEAFTTTKSFYTKVGELAKSRGVSISVISLVGEDCKLELLSPLADLTTGDILRVDPTNVSHDFANILAETIIATNVELRVKLHKGLTFRNEDAKSISEDGTLLIRPIGNVTEGQEVTLEYCAKPSAELKKMADFDLGKVRVLPFQTQINYLSLDGMKCVRLITKTQELTFEREEAKREADYAVLSVNAVQQTARLAKEGQYRRAQANAHHWKHMMRGTAAYEDYMVSASPLYDSLQRHQEHTYISSAPTSLPARNPMGGLRAPREAGPEQPPRAPDTSGPSVRSVTMASDTVVSEATRAQKTNIEKLQKK